MSRRKLLPVLSALWLVLAVLSGLLIGVLGQGPAVIRWLLAAGVLGLGAFVITGWAVAAQDQRKSQQGQPSRQQTGLTLDDLQAMTPSGFESWVQQLFRSRGYFAHNTPDSNDHGVDLWVVSPQGERAVVQCKRYRGVVGGVVIRELYGVMRHEGTPRGFLVTTGTISAPARRWAQGKPIELIDGARLAVLASGRADPGEPLAGKETDIDG